MSKKTYSLYVEYDGGIDTEKDEKIRKIVGGKPGGSGCCLFGEGTRDLEFVYKTHRELCAACNKLLDAKLFGVRVEAEDDNE